MDMHAAIRNFVFLVLGLFLFKISVGDSLLHDQNRDQRSDPATQDVQISE